MSETMEPAAAPADAEQMGTLADEIARIKAPPATDDAPPAAPEPEAPEAEDTAPEGDEEAAPPEPEAIVLKFGDKELKLARDALPDDVRAAFEEFTAAATQAAETEKAAAARLREEAETQAKLAQRFAQLQQEHVSVYAQAEQTARDLAELDKITPEQLMELARENPTQAQQLLILKQTKREQYDRAIRQLEKIGADLDASAQQETAKLEEQGRAYVAQRVKGWTPDTERELIAYAVREFGINEQDAKQWPRSPTTAVAMWKAMQFDKLQAEAAKAAQAPKTPPSKPVKPVVGGVAPARRAPEDMSDDEYYRWEMARQAKKRRA